MNYSDEFEMIVDTLEKSGGERELLQSNKVASMVVAGNKILMKNLVEGIHIQAEETATGVNVKLKIDDHVKMEYPVHLCFGVVHKTGKQVINSEYIIGNNVTVEFMAHCSFPRAEDVQHIMQAKMDIADNSVVKYQEVHFHGPEGGIEVIPIAQIKMGKNSIYTSEFKLIEGRVGRFDLDYAIDVGENSVAELNAKLYGKGNDQIKIKEAIHLNGSHSKGIAKSRIVNTNESSSEVMGEVIGNAPYARGHIDCTEIVEGLKASASAVPLVKVTHPLAKVTHEASIGSVDKQQMETLMARGLNEEDAIDVIVKGLLT
ncbi:SufD family Fe-S cluster assembly protein [candidate division KSB1 bacterium]|nr:SufD family Fe-S cluster assembly protein [candidate division KSB1 bacterium]